MQFLKNQSDLFFAVVSLLTLMGIWQIAAKFSGASVHVFPGPIDIMTAMFALIMDGSLMKHSVASLYRVTTGFYLAAVLGIPLGIIIARLKWIERLLNPILQFMRPISPLAWIPLALLWFGIGDPPAIFLIFLASFFPLALATMVAVNSINPVYFKVATNFNFSQAEILRKVVLPAIFPDVITALRLTLGIAWLVVVAAEMIAVQSGLGYLILDSRNALRIDYVLISMITIGLIGMFLDYLMCKLSQSRFTYWKKAEQ